MFQDMPFIFPNGIHLKKTMSDILNGHVTRGLISKEERKIGFTLRVGGGGSPIEDRRNWDGYVLNNKVVRLQPKQGLEMMGFPKSFRFPVSNNQAMKQLGNSVAVNVVQKIGNQMQIHMDDYFK